MTTIYVLANGFSSSPTALEAQLSSLLGDRYPVKHVETLAGLLACLSEDTQAVVVLAGKLESLPSLMADCRSVLPATSFVAVLEEGVSAEAFPVWELDCHFLRLPADAFAIQSQVVAAVRQAELLATVANAPQLDEVSNLFNRRYFMQRLGSEISLAARHQSSLCCVVLGIHFYQVYLDSYGYQFVNALLRFLADQIGGMVRQEDLVARLGDDEIAILLPRSPEAGARIFTERLVRALNAATFTDGAYEEALSVCAGMVGYPLPDGAQVDADGMIRYARHALHHARQAEDEGRAVVFFSDIKLAL